MRSKIFTIALFFFFFVSLVLKAHDKEVDSLKNILNKMPDDTNKVNTLRLLFIATIDKHSANEALPIAMTQLQLAKKLNYPKGIAQAYKLSGVAYWSMANMEKAIENYLNALKFYEKLDNNTGTSGCYYNIGMVYMEQNELNDALYYFRKGLATGSRSKNNYEGRWRGELNIGIVYEKQKKDTLALKSYLASLKISENLKKSFFTPTSQYHIASIYFKWHNYNVAELYLLRALNNILKTGEIYPTSEIYCLLSNIYLTKDQPNKALTCAKKALKIGQKANYKNEVLNGYMQLSIVYAALKKFNKAFNYQKQYIALKDSLQNVANVQKIAKLQYNYQLDKKEDINQHLLKDKQLKEAEISLQKLTIKRQYDVGIIIAIVLIFSIVLLIFYYKNFQAKQRDNELLNQHQQEILHQNEAIKAQNEEIYQQKETLSKLNHTKDKLFSIISHDLRSPILTLQHTLSLFNEQLLTTQDVAALAKDLLSNVESTSEMLDNVLYWAKNQMDSEIITYTPQAFDMSELVRINMNIFKEPAENKKITLVNNANTNVNVMADKPTIDIVLRNLMSNAIKFCSAGDTITISQIIKDGFLQLSVADTGRGISAEIQKKLFDRFVFHSTNGTANEKGTGLGLNLCLDLVTRNGGSIWVESELGQGSVFIFTIPLA